MQIPCPITPACLIWAASLMQESRTARQVLELRDGIKSTKLKSTKLVIEDLAISISKEQGPLRKLQRASQGDPSIT